MRSLAFISIIFFTPILASANIDYTVTPLVIDVDVAARDIVTRQITITNTGAQPVTIYPTVNNVSQDTTKAIDAFVQAVQSDRTQSLSSWIEISRAGIDLKPQEVKTIDITVRMPPEPKPGEYHAFIGFPFGGHRGEAEKQVEAGNAPGTILSVSVTEHKNELLRLTKFIVERFVTKQANQAAVYTFANPGDETLIPKGEIIVYDSRGKEVGAVNVNPDNTPVPPGQEHTFAIQMPTEGLFGKYKAFLSVEYGSEQRATVHDTSYFYVLQPKAMMTIAVLFLVLVTLLAWYTHKKYFDEDVDDTSDQIMLRIKDSISESKEHDINLKNGNGND